jgi:hypothetical protein
MKAKIWTREKELFISSKIKSYKNKFSNLGYYDIVFVQVNDEGHPIQSEASCFNAFTSKDLVTRSLTANDYFDIANDKYSLPVTQVNLRPYMLGDLVFSLCDSKKVQYIKINPVLTQEDSKEVLLHEEIIFIPIQDQLTGKFMLTPPEEAMALLALNPEDQKRMGMEMVFYCVTNKNLPERYEDREEILAEMIEELSFCGPRVPIKKGSGSLLCVILNLENAMEETAFIRNYKTLDEHSDVIFVTSDLKIKTGDLHQINYDGDSIDTIFGPIINWQRSNEKFTSL